MSENKLPEMPEHLRHDGGAGLTEDWALFGKEPLLEEEEDSPDDDVSDDTTLDVQAILPL